MDMKKPNFSNNQLDELTKRIAGTTDRLEAASSLTGPLVWTSVASATADLDGTFQLRTRRLEHWQTSISRKQKCVNFRTKAASPIFPKGAASNRSGNEWSLKHQSDFSVLGSETLDSFL